MSAGWGDTYVAALYDQWIDVGTTPLADGSYAIRSTADPDNRLMETNDFNNGAQTYFTVLNGRIAIATTPPTCTVQQAAGSTNAVNDPTSATVGTMVRLGCTRFGNGEPVDFYWGSVNTAVRATATASSTGSVSTFLEVPASSLGVHYWIAKGRNSGSQAAVILNTIPSVTTSPQRDIVGTKITATVRGFSAGEDVQIRFYKAGTVVATTQTLTVSSSGSGEIQFPVPAVPFGVHLVEAVGQQSGAIASGSFQTAPSIELSVDEADVGDQVGVNLRGFAAGETVTISIGSSKIEIGETVASHSGSASASTNKVIIPDLPTATYTVFAIGSISGIAVAAELVVESSGSSTDPTETATNTPEPTATESPTIDTISHGDNRECQPGSDCRRRSIVCRYGQLRN